MLPQIRHASPKLGGASSVRIASSDGAHGAALVLAPHGLLHPQPRTRR